MQKFTAKYPIYHQDKCEAGSVRRACLEYIRYPMSSAVSCIYLLQPR